MMNPASDMYSRLRGIYLILLFGAVTLPMLPIWQGGVRSLAGVTALLAMSRSNPSRWILGLFLLLAWLVSLGGWFVAFAQNPVSHTIHALTDVFGQPVGLVPDLALLGFDLLTVLLLGFVLWTRYVNAWPRVFTGGLTVFWLLSLLTLAFAVIGNARADAISNSVTALSGWATWIYWGFLALILFQAEHVEAAIKTIALAALVAGGIVLVQWIAEDYSYFLGALDGNSIPFYRVRGTDYYHAPAALITTFGVLAIIGLMPGRVSFWPVTSACFLLGVTVLNNTRAISLSLIAGLLVLAGLNASRRSWGVAGVALLATALVLPNTLYLKPPSQIASRQAVPAERASPPASTEAEPAASGTPFAPPPPASVDNVAKANTARSSLAVAGLALVRQHLLLGTGPGLLDVPLEGNTFGGISSTYSTHVLFLDLLLMSGGPAFLSCMLALAASLIGGLGLALRGESPRFLAEPALVAMLAAFAVASVFLPQERNEVIGVAFACAGLLLCRQGHTSDIKTDRNKGTLPGSYLAAVSLAACGWALVTSPAYIFPAIELVGRHGGEIVRNRQDVFVTDPALKRILQSLLMLRGGEGTQVKILKDGAQALEYDNSWILWSPMHEREYPELIAELGHRQYPRHLYPLGIGTPDHWWVMPSAQPVVTFLFAGVRDAFDTGTAVTPNRAPVLDIRVSGNVGGDPRSVADRNNGTAVSWLARETAVIEFRPRPGQNPGRLSLYQLSALHRRSMSVSGFYSWRLEGAQASGEWRTIDQVIDYPIGTDPARPSLFTVEVSSDFDRYRLIFKAAKGVEDASYSGLSEVQMHFK